MAKFRVTRIQVTVAANLHANETSWLFVVVVIVQVILLVVE
jgi:hypothetical protein